MYNYFLLFKKKIFCEFYLWRVTSWPLPVITGKCSNARETPLIRPKSLALLQPTALAAYLHLTELLQPIKSQPSQPSWLMKEKKKTSSLKEYLSVHHDCIWSTIRCFRLLIWKMEAFLLSNLLFIPPSMRRSWVWGRDWFLGVSLEQIWK